MTEHRQENGLTCTCGRAEQHAPECPWAVAFRFRCPGCKARRPSRGHPYWHANHCEFKEIRWP